MLETVFDPKVASAFCGLIREVASPFALRVEQHLVRGDWKSLVNENLDPRSYGSPQAYAKDAQILALFSKCAGLPTGIDLEEEAKKSFWQSEKTNYTTNEKLMRWDAHPEECPPAVRAVIQRARKIISDILGPCPTLQALGHHAKHGPGSTFSDRAPLTTVPDKMSENPTLTDGAVLVLEEWAQTRWFDATVPSRCGTYKGRPYKYVRGNRFATAPKNSKTHRGICIEPSINLFYQLATGTWIRKRLKRKVSIDLDHGQETHKEAARLGSLNDSNATIDLKSASDTICIALVWLLLPPQWFNLLWALRSPFTFIDGRWVKLEKFSSMGNGYTFELETLIFYALARAAGGLIPSTSAWRPLVYGDDIIVPQEFGPIVVECLKAFGFTPNTEKTFLSGPFRESCGGDFFQGVPVRAHYCREAPCDPLDYMLLHNGLLRTMGDQWYVKRLVEGVPKRCRVFGPESLGDGVFQSSDPDRHTIRVRNSIRYYRVVRPQGLVIIPWENWRPEVVLASALYGCGDGSSRRRAFSSDISRVRFSQLGVTPRALDGSRGDKPQFRGYKLGWRPHS